MLVLSRKSGESIQIADNVEITVGEVRGGRVRLLINAPETIRIVRQEVLPLERELELEADEAG